VDQIACENCLVGQKGCQVVCMEVVVDSIPEEGGRVPAYMDLVGPWPVHQTEKEVQQPGDRHSLCL
jgi:hypothetical protein